MIAIALLLVAFFVALIVAKGIRSKKHGDSASNRYRSYRSERSTSPRVRPNRYHRQTQREPSLGYEHTSGVDITSAPDMPESQDDAMDSDDVLGLKKDKPPMLVTIHVMAPEATPYTGYELLQTLLSVDMRYGQHHIFHRHKENTGRGAILFSLASAAKPGTFDLPKMGAFSTPGLSLFFQADTVRDPLAVYDLMLQTTDRLVESLGGQVYDETYTLLTTNRVVEQRQRLREYSELHRMSDLFEAIKE